MKNRRVLLKSSLLAAAAMAAAGALWWESGPAQAQLAPWNTSLVRMSGLVTDPGETVSFSGDAKVNTRLAPDPDFGAPSLLMSIDLSGISGVGRWSGARYVISGPEIVQKRLAPSYAVEITFPFARSGGAARTGIASFALSVNTATGAVTSASGSITTPDL